MSCKDCGKNKNMSIGVDRRGNPINTELTDMAKYENDIQTATAGGWPKTFNEYLKLKKDFNQKADEARKVFLRKATEDVKRMQVHELLSVYNHEEASRSHLSPSQALKALWDICHLKEYNSVVDEFPGLREQVELKYEKIKKTKINASWSPK